MTFCENCGAERHEAAEPEVVVEAEHTESADVEIARITADRDVKIAKISAGMVETETAVELAHAEGVTEGLEATVAPDEPAADAPPVVVLNDDQGEEMPEAPPEAEEHHEEPHEPRASHGANSGWFH